MSNKKIILHIGLPKTATSFLQSCVFPLIKGICYFGHGNLETETTPFISLDELNKFTISNSNKNQQNIIKVKNELLNYINILKKKDILFSSEMLTGYLGRYTHNFFNYSLGFSNYLVNAQTIKEIFNEMKIVFVIRKQTSWAESLYNWHITKHTKYFLDNNSMDQSCICGIKEYFGYKNDRFVRGKCFDLKDLNWYKMAKDYINIFGQENVLVLPYELLKENPNEFLEKFYDFTGFEPYYPEKIEIINSVSSLNSIKYSPYLSRYNDVINNIPNGFFKNFIQKNDRGFKNIMAKYKKEFNISREKFTVTQKNKIMQHFKESNKALSEIMGISLAQYDYYE